MAYDAAINPSTVCDFASEYEYCIVLNTSDDGSEVDEDGQSFLDTFYKNGLEMFAFIGTNKKYLYVMMKAPLNKLREICDLIDMKLLLDAEELKKQASIGFPEKNIAPIEITHLPNETSLSPYMHIYAPYKINVPDNLYWRPPNRQYPFRESVRFKVAFSLIQSRTPDGGEPVKIERNMAAGKILGFFPLHRPDKREQLVKLWMTCSAKPWSEPLLEIKLYFGEKIGLFFAFMCHYTSWLILPGAVGLVLQVFVLRSDDFSSPVLPPFAVFICLWGIIMLEYWKRKERYIALKWGMIEFESSDKDRPEFQGDEIMSYIDGKPMRYFPTKRRNIIKTFSRIVLAFMILTVISVIVAIYVLKYLRYFDQTLASIFNAVQIQTFNFIYSIVANSLTKLENYRTETDYEDSLISKLFVFQFVNSYSSFFYLAFIAKSINECGFESSCMRSLAINLGIIFASNLTVGNIIEVVIPIIQFRLNLRTAGLTIEEYHKLPRPEQEFLLIPFDNTKGNIENMSEIIVQYGYMVLFITCLPIAATFCFFYNLLEMKMDGYKLLNVFQRPLPRGAEDIGTWQTFFTLTTATAVLTNAGLVAFTMDTLNDYMPSTRLWIFIGFILFCFGVQLAITLTIPDEPPEVKIQLKRTQWLVNKMIHQVADDVDVDLEHKNKFYIELKSYPLNVNN